MRALADLPAPALLLPEDTLAALSLPNATAARTNFEASNMGRLWNDVSMLPFRTQFETGFRTQFATPFEKESGLDLTLLLGLARGQITLALLKDGWKSGGDNSPGPAWVLVFDTGDQTPKLSEILATTRQRIATNSTLTPKPFKIGDASFTSMTLSLQSAVVAEPNRTPKGAPNVADMDSNPIQISFGQVGTAFFAGSSPEALRRIVVRATSTNLPSGLQSKPYFKSVEGDAFKEAAAWVYLDVSAFYEQMVPELSSVFGMLTLLDADPAKVVPATGLASIKAMGVAIHHSPQGLVSVLRIIAPANERTGVTKLFETRSLEASPPPNIPAIATSFLRWRIDGKAGWKALDDALKRISPQVSSIAQLTLESAGQAFDSNFNLQRDLANNLGDDFISFTLPVRGTNLAQPAKPVPVQLISSSNPDRLIVGWKAMEALIHMQSGALQFSERTGPKNQKILVAKTTANEGGKTVFNLATNGTYIVVAETPEALDLYLTGSTNTLANLPDLAAASALSGGTTNGVFGLYNSREEMRGTWEALRTDRGIDTLMPVGTTSLDAMRAIESWADFKRLPAFDQIARFWTAGAMSGGSDAGGFFFRWVTLKAN
ncbi:MAG: hypothetical protein EXS25_05225 [Pedosphaera sp.]|nr:hypothetical protein [Pedosphaera sp.]